jgi:hypothetical protein
MRLAVAAIAFLSTACLGAPASAATLESIAGQVSINRGNGFQRVMGAVEANVGDAIMVGPGGRARVVYGDGCPVNVDPGSVVRIEAQSPCAAHAQIGPALPAFPAASFAAPAAVAGGSLARSIYLRSQTSDRPASP